MRASRNDSSGYALLSTLFIVILLISALTGTFLGVTRQQRSAQRVQDRADLNWLSQGAFEISENLFGDYIRENGTYPPLDADGEVKYPDTGTGAFFSQTLTDFITGNLAIDGVSIELVSIKQLVPVPSDSDPQDPSRDYEVKIKVRDSRTGERLYSRQTLTVKSGKLFDFAVFYDKDLEIAPGPSSLIQGPIFSNGDIYLMTNADTDPAKGLKLLMPGSFEGSEPAENYILRSAGSIQFYFKRMLGENYMLQYDAYRENLPDYYLTAYGTTRSGLAPLGDLVGAVGPGRPFEIAPSWIRLDADARNQNRYLPYYYYAYNGAQKGHYEEYNYAACGPSTRCSSNYISLTREDGQTPVLPGRRFLTPNFSYIPEYGIYWPSNPPYSGYKTALSLLGGSYGTSWVNAGNAVITVSPMTDAAHFPELYPDWTPEFPSDDNPGLDVDDAPPHPNWKNGQLFWPYVRDGVEPKILPVGAPRDAVGNDPRNPNHILIEPLKPSVCPVVDNNCVPGDSCDCPSVQAAKLESKADLHIRCANTNCETFCVKTSPTGSCQNDTMTFVSADRFYDYRLQSSYASLDIDLGALKAYFDGHPSLDQTEAKDGLVVYAEVLPMDQAGNSNSIRLVRLTNAGQIPVRYVENKLKGFTFVTNGRVWLQGDYNIYPYDPNDITDPSYPSSTTPCSYEGIRDQSCAVPPSAIFADSLGILSKEWQDTYTAGFSRTNRPAASPVMVNAAFVAGYLPTQLKKNFEGPPASHWGLLGNTALQTTDVVYSGTNPNYYILDMSKSYLQSARSRFDSAWPPWSFDAGAKIPVITGDMEQASERIPVVPVRGAVDYPGMPFCRIIRDNVIGYPVQTYGCLGARSYCKTPPKGESATGPNDISCLEDYPADYMTGADCGSFSTKFQEYRFICHEGVTVSGGVRTLLPALPRGPYSNEPCNIDDLNGGWYDPAQAFDPLGKFACTGAGCPVDGCDPATDATCPYHVTRTAANLDDADPANDRISFDRYGAIIYLPDDDAGGHPVPRQRTDAAGNPLYYIFCPGYVCQDACPEFTYRNDQKVYRDINGDFRWWTSSMTPSNPGEVISTNSSCLTVGSQSDLSGGLTKSKASIFLWKLYDRLQFVDVYGNPIYGYSYQSDPNVWQLVTRIVAKPLADDYSSQSWTPYGSIALGALYFRWRTQYVAGDSSSNKIFLRPYGGKPAETKERLYPHLVLNTRPNLGYYHSRYLPLYEAKYSGGYESLINFQEDWRQPDGSRTKFYFTGVTTAPWFSNELRLNPGSSSTPAYYGTDYYTAPERTYSYYQRFTQLQPPATPGLYSVTRAKVQEELDPDEDEEEEGP